MRAILLVGHGSLLAGSGAAMIRLAARLRQQQIAPLATAGFLNYSRPTLKMALQALHAKGSTEVIFQPYFLVAGWFVNKQLPKQLKPLLAEYPNTHFLLAEPLLDHPRLAQILLARANASISPVAFDTTAILVVAHGSPDEAANRPIAALVQQMQTFSNRSVTLAYLGLNRPLLADALLDLTKQGWQRIVVVPHFLQLGGHVAEDLPAIVAEVQQQYPTIPIDLAGYIGYEPALVHVIADRVAEAREA